MSALSNEYLMAEPETEDYNRMLDRDPNYRVHRVADVLGVTTEQAELLTAIARLLTHVPEASILMQSALRTAQYLRLLAQGDHKLGHDAENISRYGGALNTHVGNPDTALRETYLAMRKNVADDDAKPV